MKCGGCNLEVADPCENERGQPIHDASKCPNLIACERGSNGRPMVYHVGVHEAFDMGSGSEFVEMSEEHLKRLAPNFSTAAPIAA